MARSRSGSTGLPVGAWAGIVAGSVLLIGVAVWLILQARGDDAPAEPIPSPTPSVTPSPSPSPSPSEQPWQIVSEEDREILERLMNPTTGEVWHEPILLDDLGLVDWEALYAKVGDRGDAEIIVAVDEWTDPYSYGHRVIAMFEREDDEVRMILCPSARSTDACAPQWSEDWLRPGRSFDTTTHYDSLTYPRAVMPEPGLTINTDYRNPEEDYVGELQVYGHASWWPFVDFDSSLTDYLILHDPTTVIELGESRLVTSTAPGVVNGSTLITYSMVTPFGTAIPTVWWAPADPDYDVGTVTWNDGRDTFTHTVTTWEGRVTEAFPVVPAADRCTVADEAVIDAIPASWVAAGTTASGREVFLPTSADDPVLTGVFEYMEAYSHDIEFDGMSYFYHYDSAAELLDARGLFAWERYDGTWALAMDAYGLNNVYECA